MLLDHGNQMQAVEKAKNVQAEVQAIVSRFIVG